MDGFATLPHTADGGNSEVDGFALGAAPNAEGGNSGVLGLVERIFFLV